MALLLSAGRNSKFLGVPWNLSEWALSITQGTLAPQSINFSLIAFIVIANNLAFFSGLDEQRFSNVERVLYLTPSSLTFIFQTTHSSQ